MKKIIFNCHDVDEIFSKCRLLTELNRKMIIKLMFIDMQKLQEIIMIALTSRAVVHDNSYIILN